MPASIFAQRWAKCCQRYRFGIIALWLAVSILGFFYGLKFLDHTVSDFPAPQGSPSYDATLTLVTFFPELKNAATESLLLQASDGQCVTNGTLAERLSQFYNEYQSSVSAAYGSLLKGPIVAYYPLAKLMPALAGPLVSGDKAATIFLIGYDPTGGDSARSAFLSFLHTEARRLLTAQGLQDITVGLTGLGSFGEDIVEGIKTDAARMDSTVLPLALLVMALVVHSLPLMIIPILTIPVALLAQFLVMCPVALKVDVASFAPSLMMSLTIAMGIDYNLFQATRFMDGVRAKLELLPAVTLMLQSAGYIILVSGSTLCVSFLGLLFLPMEILRSLGLGASISILMALAVNLSLLPALLFTIGPDLLRAHAALTHFFCTLPKRLGRRRRRGLGSGDKSSSGLLTGPGADAPLLEGGQEESRRSVCEDGPHEFLHLIDDEHHLDESCWLRLARLVARKRWGLVILVAVLGLALPVMLQVFHMQPSVQFDLMLPSTSDSYSTLHAITDKFGGPGVVFPYRLVMVLQPDVGSTAAEGILSSRAYDAMTYTLQQLIERLPFTTLSDFTGVAAVGGAYVSYNDMQAALGSSAFDPYYLTLRKLAATVVSSDQQATYLTLTPGLDPYSPKGQEWLESLRDVLCSLESQTGLDMYLEGGGATIHDAVGSVLKVFPVMISITLTIVFVLIGLAFSSVVAPLRSVLSVSLTLAFVYGLTVLVYQGGALEALGARAVSQVGSVAWLPLVICFSVIVGLALDYDIFLISTVLERRMEGHTDRSALVRGMVSTGHIITAAGIIMAVAFSGLLFSSELALNQTAFLLVASVLLDTFVVRTFLVPILMTLTGRYTWWPRKDLPPPTKDYHL